MIITQIMQQPRREKNIRFICYDYSFVKVRNIFFKNWKEIWENNLIKMVESESLFKFLFSFLHSFEKGNI
jgi:hypothetical protein